MVREGRWGGEKGERRRVARVADKEVGTVTVWVTPLSKPPGGLVVRCLPPEWGIPSLKLTFFVQSHQCNVM